MAKKNITINDLAGMVKAGFDETSQELKNVHNRLENVENHLENVEKGQEEIKLKLDNVAYRFELVELQRRVEILEKRAISKRFATR